MWQYISTAWFSFEHHAVQQQLKEQDVEELAGFNHQGWSKYLHVNCGWIKLLNC